MSAVNTVFNGLFEAILWPTKSLPPSVTIAILALLSAMGMLVVFKKTSDQERLARVKGRIFACIFEIRLFNDDLRAIFRAQRNMLKHNLVYAGLSLVPAVWLIVPFVLVIAQLQSHYGWKGLELGQSTLLKAQLTEGWSEQPGLDALVGGSKPPVRLEVPDGIRIETRPVWMPTSRELAWRVVGEQEGVYDLKLHLGDASAAKRIYVGIDEGARSPARTRPSFLHQLLYPAESPYPSQGPVQSISIGYPDRSIDVFGFGIHWLILYFVLSLVFAFALRNRFGVTI